MNEVIQKLQKGNHNYESFKEMDAEYSFGISSRIASSKKISYQSTKKVHVVVDLHNPQKQLPIEKQRGGNESIVCSLKQKLAILDKQTKRICYLNSANKIVVADKCENRCGYLFTSLDKLETKTARTDEELKEEYKKRIKGVTEICDAFGINPEETAYCSPIVTRNIAYECVKYLQGTENINDEEAKIILGSSRGAIHYAEKREVEDCFDYDVNSMYGFMFLKSSFMFPVTAPIKVPIEEEDDENCLYIYELKIKGHHKYFNRTPDNFYNTYHVELLNLLDVDYEKVGDCKYKYECPISSGEIFGDCVRKLYELKANGNKYAKEVMNNFHSSLSQLKQTEIPIEEYTQMKHNAEDVVDIDIETGMMTLKSKDKMFKHKFGRMQSFTFSFARLYFVKKYLLKIEKKGYEIYQANTDGFISNCPIEKMKKWFEIDNEIGSLKVKAEYKGKWKIEHVTSIVKVK